MEPVEDNHDMALTPDDDDEEVFEDPDRTVSLVDPPGGLNDTILSGTGNEGPLSSTDPGLSQSIIHRPSSTLAPNMVECDHSSVNDTQHDSFLDPENKFELGEATLKETAELAKANALSRENREFNRQSRRDSVPITCSNPGQTQYPVPEDSQETSQPDAEVATGHSHRGDSSINLCCHHPSRCRSRS